MSIYIKRTHIEAAIATWFWSFLVCFAHFFLFSFNGLLMYSHCLEKLGPPSVLGGRSKIDGHNRRVEKDGPYLNSKAIPYVRCGSFFVVFLLEFFWETVKESFPAIHLSCKNCNKIAVPRGTTILLRFSCENFDKIASQYVPKSLLSCNVPELPWFSFRFVCFAS